MKILIYGLAQEALFLKRALKKEHTILGFTDSFANIKSYAGLPFYNRNTLYKIDFDYIILALRNRNISECVKKELLDEGIEEEKIIDFMQLFTRQKVDKVMSRFKNEKNDGIILGLSHALHGINPDYLPGTWKNLSTAGEDIYYHYKVLKKCVECYANTIADLKYAIIDMYDYVFFNYDVSLSRNILGYWSWGGYAEDIHHFKENKNYNGNIEEEMKKAGLYFPVTGEKELRVADQLFDIDIIEHEMEYICITSGGDGFRDHPLWLRLNQVIPEKPMLPYNLYYMGEDLYPQTIKENKFILGEMIRLLKQVNPKIKIYFILIPRFGNMEKYHARLLMREKAEFEEIMSSFLKEDTCYYYDFKQCKEINSNRYFFGDVAHLNYMGGIAFTGLLNKWINETLS